MEYIEKSSQEIGVVICIAKHISQSQIELKLSVGKQNYYIKLSCLLHITLYFQTESQTKISTFKILASLATKMKILKPLYKSVRS